MVYGGLVNKNIVAGLQARGVNALGLTGADMDVIRSVKRPVKEIDYGFVGDVKQVNGDFLGSLIRKGVVPVMAPLTHDGEGHMLNTHQLLKLFLRMFHRSRENRFLRKVEKHFFTLIKIRIKERLISTEKNIP